MVGWWCNKDAICFGSYFVCTQHQYGQNHQGGSCKLETSWEQEEKTCHMLNHSTVELLVYLALFSIAILMFISTTLNTYFEKTIMFCTVLRLILCFVRWGLPLIPNDWISAQLISMSNLYLVMPFYINSWWLIKVALLEHLQWVVELEILYELQIIMFTQEWNSYMSLACFEFQA